MQVHHSSSLLSSFAQFSARPGARREKGWIQKERERLVQLPAFLETWHEVKMATQTGLWGQALALSGTLAPWLSGSQILAEIQ